MKIHDAIIRYDPCNYVESLIRKNDTNNKTQWQQLAVIITTVALLTLLSYSTILPQPISLVVIYGIKMWAWNIVAALVYGIGLKIFKCNQDQKVEDNRNDLKSTPPCIITLLGPIEEEIIYRGIVQSSLQLLFSQVNKLAISTLLGMPLTCVLAITGSSLIFGFRHKVGFQCMVTTISGIVYGILKCNYGLWAAILEHITFNSCNELLFLLSSNKQ